MADTYQVLNLAAIIREVDGSNNKGAAALAESILDHPRFRAVLAGEPAVPEGREPASVTGQPSDEELLDLLPQGNESGFWLPKGLPSDWVDGEFIAPPKAIIAFARDVLELWGNPAPPPPADGEVAELVAWLRETGDTIQPSHLAEHQRYKRAAELLQRQVLVPPPADGEVADVVRWLKARAGIPASPDFPAVAAYLTRAAELLQRQVLVPVSVSERLPGPEDCDAIGCCWWYSASHGWELYHRENGLGTSTHWLPAHALPLPEAGE